MSDIVNERLFEVLVSRVLQAENFELDSSIGGRDRGYDVLAKDRDSGLVWIVECMQRTSPPTVSELTSKGYQLMGVAEQMAAERLLIAVGQQIPVKTVEKFKQKFPRIELWDITEITGLLAKHPVLKKEYADLVNQSLNFAKALPAQPTPTSVATKLLAELQTIRPGRDDWRAL